jgi:hypothetical protein
MWSQVVGKVRLALATPMAHWWHITLYVTARGLTTSPMPCGGRLVELEFDLIDHRLVLRASDGRSGAVELRPMSVAAFYAETMDLLRAADVNVRIWPVPVEVEAAIPFEQDIAPGGYDPAHAAAIHRALIDADRVLTTFRGRYLGKASPVHFFWGSFDLATSRFSGRPAPRHPGGVPNCPDYVMVEAYSHEVSSAGWWPGPDGRTPAFYSYIYPEPAGYSTARTPPMASYDRRFGEFVVADRDVAAADDPDATALEFLETTYAAGANLARWDRAALERPSLAANSSSGSAREGR